MNISRDLFLLSAVAFQQGDFDKAASLFASSLSADDAEEFLSKVDSLDTDPIGLSESKSSDKSKLSDIARIIRNSLKNAFALEAMSSEDDLEDDTDIDEDHTGLSADDGDDTDMNSDEDIESDDVDGDVAGEKIIPSALSSVNSAVKVKQ